jgi:periplasmic protein TonB
MIAFLLALLALDPATAAPSAQAARPQLLWRKPDGSVFQRAYPWQALQRGTEGSSKIECTLVSDSKRPSEGTLDACHVIEETPKGAGFGDAALKVARFYKIKTADGSPIEGLKIVIPITWSLHRH